MTIFVKRSLRNLSENILSFEGKTSRNRLHRDFISFNLPFIMKQG